MGDKWRQDPREGGRAIQQRETRRGTMGDKGVQDPQEGGHTIQQRETRRGTVGDKGREDPREGGHTIQQRETRRGRMGDKGRQDPREGGYTIQHQGGHLKIALRIPNSTLFREKRWSNFGHKTTMPPPAPAEHPAPKRTPGFDGDVQQWISNSNIKKT